MDEKHKELLKFHRTRFLQCVDIDRLIPLLQTNGVLSNDDVTDLRKYSSSGAKAEKLLDLLPSKGSQAFQAFCLALETTYPHLLTVMFLGGSKKMRESGKCLQSYYFVFIYQNFVPSKQLCLFLSKYMVQICEFDMLDRFQDSLLNLKPFVM